MSIQTAILRSHYPETIAGQVYNKTCYLRPSGDLLTFAYIQLTNHEEGSPELIIKVIATGKLACRLAKFKRGDILHVAGTLNDSPCLKYPELQAQYIYKLDNFEGE